LNDEALTSTSQNKDICLITVEEQFCLDNTCVDGSSGHEILLLATAANKPLIIDSAAFSYHPPITAIPVGLPWSTGI
jgi:hypothetical protein